MTVFSTEKISLKIQCKYHFNVFLFKDLLYRKNKAVFDKKESTYMKDNRCFYLASLKILADNGMKKEYNAFKSEVIRYLKLCIEMNSEYELPMSIREFSSLRRFFRLRSDLARSLRRSLNFAWMSDFDILLSFHKSETVRSARLPNLDGLYGGKPCIRSVDKSNLDGVNQKILFAQTSERLTIRDDTDKHFDKGKMHNQFPEDRHEFWDQCGLIDLCDYPIQINGKKPIPVKSNCERYAWAGTNKIFPLLVHSLSSRVGILGKM